MQLVLGTRNRKKRGEIAEILGDLGLDLADLSAWPDFPEVEESGDTFEANARLKATAVAIGTKQWALGEDSGLVVPALGGAARRVFGPLRRPTWRRRSQQRQITGRLGLLRGRPAGGLLRLHRCAGGPDRRRAPVVEGRCHGVIIHAARGSGGFGYDPLFLIPEYHRTFGELSANGQARAQSSRPSFDQAAAGAKGVVGIGQIEAEAEGRLLRGIRGADFTTAAHSLEEPDACRGAICAFRHFFACLFPCPPAILTS